MDDGADLRDLQEVAERIIDAHSAVNRWSSRDFKRSASPSGLTQTQFAILGLSHGPPGMNASQLADQLDLTVPTVVRAIDALARKGLIVRRRNIQDQREVVIVVTPEGERVREAFGRARRERLAGLLDVLSEQEVHGLVLGYEGLARAARMEEEEESRAV